MKKCITLLLFLVFNAGTLSAEIKIGFVEIQKILKGAPQTVAANKKLEKEFTKRTNKLKKNSKKNK